jgi:hypothetical protein
MKYQAITITVLAIVVATTALLATGQDKPTTAPAAATAGQVVGGEWKVADGIVTQTGLETPALVLFGDKTWKDYTIELEAQKTGGDEGFLIAVRAIDDQNLVWFNVGGWGNTRSAFEGISAGEKTDFLDNQTYSPFVEVKNDKWHKLKVTVAGDKIEGFLDDVSACKATMSNVPPAGRVAIGTWSTPAKFRNIKVTAPDGKVLWEGTLAVGK